MSTLLFCNQFGFILSELTLDNFFYEINGYIHIAAFLLGTDNVSFYRNRNFDFLTFFFYTECNDNVSFRSKILFQFS